MAKAWGQVMAVSLFFSFSVMSVSPKIKFSSHQDDGSVGTMMLHFGIPLCVHIFRRFRTYTRKANQEYICLQRG